MGVVVVLAVGAVATGAVVRFLDSLDDESEPVRCAAELDGTSWYLSPEQAQNAALITGTAVQRGLPGRAATIGLATALQESRLENIDYGDRDSVGLFQQRPSQGWGTVAEIMDPVYSTGAFYDGLVEVPGYEDLEVTVAAQAVQRSGFPDAYAQHETRARAWASALTGHSPGALTCHLPDLEAEAGDETVGDRAAQVSALAARDLGMADGTVRAADDGTVHLDAAALGGETATWTVAHWAVATASATGAVEVRAGDLVWTRADPTWHEADGDPQPEGRVTVGLVTGE